MKKLLSLMCSLLIIVTLCGCSSTQDQQEEVTLTLAAAASLENTFEDKLIPDLKKKIQISKFKEFMIQVVNYKFKLNKD